MERGPKVNVRHYSKFVALRPRRRRRGRADTGRCGRPFPPRSRFRGSGRFRRSRALHRASTPVKLLISSAGAPCRALSGRAGSALLDRRIDEDLEELAGRQQLARHGALGPERRDEGAPARSARHRPSAWRPPPTRRMFSTRSASVKPRSRLSPWRSCRHRAKRVAALACELALDQVGDGRLARARQTGEPQHHGFLIFQLWRGTSLVTLRSAGRWTLLRATAAGRRSSRSRPATLVSAVDQTGRRRGLAEMNSKGSDREDPPARQRHCRSRSR